MRSSTLRLLNLALRAVRVVHGNGIRVLVLGLLRMAGAVRIVTTLTLFDFAVFPRPVSDSVGEPLDTRSRPIEP